MTAPMETTVRTRPAGEYDPVWELVVHHGDHEEAHFNGVSGTALFAVLNEYQHEPWVERLDLTVWIAQ